MNIIEAPNFKKLVKSHENKWVAFSPDYKKIIAVGNTLNILTQKLKDERGVVMKVLPFKTGYVPFSR